MASHPDRVGPYRVTGVLGTGGMGVVLDAYDDRLDRRVAIKLLRADFVGDAAHQDRLRQEARAVAQLSHPSIVQVYDLLELPEGTALVLEYVDGESLARRLRERGPLPIDDAVRIGRELAEGLAAAHARGIVHRDLKAENVLLSGDGRAKILDFGIAKRADPARPDAISTTAGFLVGTYRTMSPEQVTGLELDGRADLFSLGVLLYESLTGGSPFLAETVLGTLERICTLDPPGLDKTRSDVPPLLTALVAQLLSKDRNRRPSSAAEVAGRLAALQSDSATATRGLGLDTPTRAEPVHPALRSVLSGPSPRRRVLRWVVAVGLIGALAAVGLLVSRPERSLPPLLIAVAEPELVLTSAEDGQELLPAGLRAAVLGGMSRLRALSALTGESNAAEPPSPRALAAALAADEVLTSRLDCASEVCRVTLTRLRAADASILRVVTFEVPDDDFQLLANAVVSYLGELYPERRAPGEAPRLPVASADYAQYLRLSQAVAARSQGEPVDPLLAEAEALRRRAPRFLEAILLEADLAGRRFFDSREPADLERAFGLLSDAEALAPSDPRPLSVRFRVALRADRLDAAEAAIGNLETLAPGDPQLSALRALVRERRGDGPGALAAMREAARRRPSFRNLLDLGNLEWRQGDITAARATLGGLLERFPANFQAQTLWANMELFGGSPERAAELYGELVARSPGLAELSNLGLAQFLLGRYAEAAESFRHALELAPSNAVSVLNLADAELLRGNRAEADDLYRRVLAEVAKDPAAGSFWQLLSVRAQALAHLERRHEAVQAMQTALRQSPGNVQLAYEAALVFALVGDRSTALVEAERAAKGGIDARWFGFPWFDSLHEDPAFAALLAGP